MRSEPALVGALILLASLCACPRSEPDTSPSKDSGASSAKPSGLPMVETSVEVIATGDVGGDSATCGCRTRPLGGLARRVAKVRGEEEKHPQATLVVDAGDAFFREPLVRLRDTPAAKAAAELQAEAMNRMNMQAMAVGDRDLALGVPYLKTLAKRAGVTLLAANLVYARTGSQAFSRFLVVERKGLKIGLVGGALEPDARSEAALAYQRAGLAIFGVEAFIADAAKDARKAGAEVVIGLFHTGAAQARAALTTLDPTLIEAVIVSHDRAIGPLERLGRRPAVVVMPGARGKALRVLTLVTKKDKLPVFEDRIEPLDLALPLDDKTAALEAAYGKALEAIETEAPSASGSNACKKCHKQAFDQWRKTKHAKARATLVAVKQGDNPECLACHGVANVGCEACHGAGAAHVKAPETVHMEFGKPVPERVCWDCHRPAADQKPFVYGERLERVKH